MSWNQCHTSLLQDRRGTIIKIADFLGKTLTDADVDRIMEHTSLENMKKNDSVNLAYLEKLKETDKSEGAFINTGKQDTKINEPWHEISNNLTF